MHVGRSPASSRATLSHMWVCPRRMLPVVMPPRCGEKSTRCEACVESWSRGFDSSTGSGCTVSRPAPARCPLSSASASALLSTSWPRAVFTRYEPGRIFARKLALTMPEVSGVTAQCRLTMSLFASSLSSPAYSIPSVSSSSAGLRERLAYSTRHPKARRRTAVACPPVPRCSRQDR